MNHKILAIIPARAGSKRLPGKHLKELCGKPLVEWTIEQAKESKLLAGRIEVNTDDIKVREIARKSVSVYNRPPRLAQDDSSIYDVIFNSLSNKDGFDIVVLLEPTSPLRKNDDIDKAIQLFLDNWDRADSLVSVGEIQLERPEYSMIFQEDKVFWLLNNEGFRQAFKKTKVYFPYGVIYISKVETLRKYKTFYQERTIPYFIERWQNFEINDECDFLCVEAILKSKKVN